MLSRNSSIVCLALLGLALTSCSNSPWASDLERSLAADPRLENGSLFGADSTTATPVQVAQSAEPQLPQNFPGEIPRYPNATLVSVSEPDRSPSELFSSTEAATMQTRWQTSDSAAAVRQFYQEQFQAEGWQLSAAATPTPTSSGSPSSPTSPTPSPEVTPSEAESIVAEQDGLTVTVIIPASENTPENPPPQNTEFTLAYQFSEDAMIAQSSPAPTSSEPAAPQPGEPDFIGPVPPDSWQPPAANQGQSASFGDLSQAPPELQPYIRDLVNLGALSSQTGSTNAGTSEFNPNAEITRRDYARWLFTANNLIYANQPARRIRPGVSGGQPAFQDVPASDPDFGAIQGLANAGLIPSPLSGDSTVVTFRPDAPLTREDLLLWKVPLDIRQALPSATIEAVQQTWGFQDTARIDPRALRAILADYQNGDLSNIRRAFGYTTLFQPDRPVSRAEAAAVLWYFGNQGDGLSAEEALQTEQASPTPPPATTEQP